MGGHGGRKKQQAKGKGAKRSGNPAKRAQEAAGISAKRAEAPTGSGFGLGAAGAAQPSEEDLAKLQQMLGKGLR